MGPGPLIRAGYQKPRHPGTSATWHLARRSAVRLWVWPAPLLWTGPGGAGAVWLPEAEPEPEAAAALRRNTLGAFLRSRRERTSTASTSGCPPGGRRRTPGLRREEVAQLAGVGVTWYTWLEQGRDINASEQVLDAVARALMLDARRARAPVRACEPGRPRPRRRRRVRRLVARDAVRRSSTSSTPRPPAR